MTSLTQSVRRLGCQSLSFYSSSRTMYTNRWTFRSRAAQPTNLNRMSHWYMQAAPIRRTVLQCLNSVPSCSIFRDLVHHSNIQGQMIHELSLPGPITLFVPSDAAMKAIAPASLEKLVNDPARLQIFIRHHMSNEYWLRRDLIGHDHQPWKETNGPREAPKMLKSAENQNVSVQLKNSFHTDVYLDGHLLSHMDIKCHNGVIHVVEGALIPNFTLKKEVSFQEI
eukprot:GDKJ01046538.1.p1 GENE.GDKJ01046538.1~~GDKJ01046538.1.p1  ORF type:complete len:224 (+),score=29.73 GDKJ01046538.1:22-693(+)